MVDAENQPQSVFDDDLLAGSVDLSRRSRWYLYLPVLVIGTFFSPRGIVAWLDVPWGNSIYSKSIVPLTVGAYVLWWWARKPRWIVLKLSGLCLVLIGLLAGGWALYSILGGDEWLNKMGLPKPIVVLWGVVWFLIFPLQIYLVGLRCLNTARVIREFSPAELPAAIAAARERVESRRSDIEDPDSQ